MKKAIFTLLCLLSAFTCQARTIIVDANGSGEYPTIQAAIDDSNDGDVVILTPGTYTGTGFGTPDADIDAPEAWEIHTKSSFFECCAIQLAQQKFFLALKDNLWYNTLRYQRIVSRGNSSPESGVYYGTRDKN